MNEKIEKMRSIVAKYDELILEAEDLLGYRLEPAAKVSKRPYTKRATGGGKKKVSVFEEMDNRSTVDMAAVSLGLNRKRGRPPAAQKTEEQKASTKKLETLTRQQYDDVIEAKGHEMLPKEIAEEMEVSITSVVKALKAHSYESYLNM